MNRLATAISMCILSACSTPDAPPPDASSPEDASADTSTDTGTTPDATPRDASTDAADAADAAPSCVALYGSPGEKTGLGSDQCGRGCDCGDAPWSLPAYTDEDVAALRTWTLAEPWPLLPGDPYADPAPAPAPEGTVCAVVPDAQNPNTYSLSTFPSREDADSAGAMTTHRGACAACSTLADLATYISIPDLTGPVRECGLKNLSGDAPDETLACLEDLGFTPACAQIWAFNTENTRKACLGPCIANLNRPYNLPDGSLNACLQCDEDESGPVFKAFAGRTRRNSGLASAICRPCDTVFRVAHDYTP